MKAPIFDKRILNILIIIFLSFFTFFWTFSIFHKPFVFDAYIAVVFIRVLSSVLILNDYSLSWSKATQKTFLIKSLVNITAFLIYMPIFYTKITVAFFLSELFLYLFFINFFMYLYYLYKNRSFKQKDKSLVIYGAGKAGLRLEEEYRDSYFKMRYFLDDDKVLQKRSVDGIKIVSSEEFIEKFEKRVDLLIIAIPSANPTRIKTIYNKMYKYFHNIKILPSLNQILTERPFSNQLKNISVEDLLARYPQDLDKELIESFLKDKKVLVTGAGGSIGSEICRQCVKYGVKELELIDHSEFNLYSINEELNIQNKRVYLLSVLNAQALEKIISTCKPDIIIHAAAYKHVPLVEENIEEGIRNNILGTKNCIDLAIKYGVKKFILISTDKAVRPTNVMGATKRVCELYAGNIPSCKTEIASVRFGNVLGSSGSVIPKFKKQIELGGPVSVTHPDMTRYFMLIPEACELVLQTGAMAKGGEIFVLDMGKPIKIVDLAKKMIELSGRDDVDIEFTGSRPGEKLFEELWIDDKEKETKYRSIMIAKDRSYDIEKLQQDISKLLVCEDKIEKLQEIVPEFNHKN